MRHVKTLFDLSTEEIRDVLRISHRLKSDFIAGFRPPWLAQRTLALLFEKPSLRTRVSFEAGMAQLGGSSIYLSQDVGWQTREATSDFVRVLAQYCDAIVCRTFAHRTVEELSSYQALPIINGLTDMAHPCQALADVMTMEEQGEALQGLQVTFVGDGNNVCRSLAHAAVAMGMRFRLLGVPGYWISDEWLSELKVRFPTAEIEQLEDASAALKDAAFVYTDVWTSMGQESESQQRRSQFGHLQLNGKLMKMAPTHCKVLHCLPAHRGEEITDEVLESPQSLVIQQAGNRLHLQKGLLVWLALQLGWMEQSELKFQT